MAHFKYLFWYFSVDVYVKIGQAINVIKARLHYDETTNS
jgi:hypothetical protein